MAGLMSQAALAIAAPGSMLNELALMAVPSIFIIAAANQRLSAVYHQQKGWCQLFAGNAIEAACQSALDLWQQPELRRQMSLLASQQIDGLGSHRVATRLMQRYGRTV
jgi:spore coat polysaccharide biosynthesis predicted glycosyltransferase SpsG